MTIEDLKIKQSIDKINTDIDDLQKHFPFSKIQQDISITTMKLSNFSNYIVVIGDDHGGDVYSTNAWLVATPRDNTKRGLVTKICNTNGENYECTLSGLTLTVTHYAYCAVSITKL